MASTTSPFPQIAAAYCVYDDDEWLPCSIASVYPLLGAIYFFVSDVPWNGPATGNQRTLETIRNFPDPDNKIRVIEGHWTDQPTQRNEACAILAVDGFAHMFIIDADEVYESDHLRSMLNYALQRPEVHCWHALFVVFWKSHRYRIDPPEEHHPPILLELGTGGFVEYRNPRCPEHDLIPPELGMCFHMSYARSDAQILRKITSCSFAPLVRENWYQLTWKAWDGDRTITDLCPYNPGVFERAIEVDFAVLPTAIQRYVENPACFGVRASSLN